MNNILLVSRLFRILFQFLFVIMLGSFLLSWIYAPNSLNLLGGVVHLNAIPISYTIAGPQGQAILHALSPTEKGSAILISLLPFLVKLFIVYYVIKLFRLFEVTDIFSLRAVQYIRRIAYFLLLGQFLHPVYEFLMGFALTWYNPPGYRFAAISFNENNFVIIFTALLIILISWIMAEAYKLREEQQLTI